MEFITEKKLKEILAAYPKSSSDVADKDFNQIAEYIIGYGNINRRPFATQERHNSIYVERQDLSDQVVIHRGWQCIAKRWRLVFSTSADDIIYVQDSGGVIIYWTLQDIIDWILSNATRHTIEDEGVALPNEPIINFVGAGVTATDAGGKTVVTIPGVAPPINLGGNCVLNAAYTGLIDDVNDTFTMPDAYEAGSLVCIYNGQNLKNGVDFTESGLDAVLSFVPTVGDLLTFNYLITTVTGDLVLNASYTDLGSGVFSTGTFLVGSLQVYLNGILQYVTENGTQDGWDFGYTPDPLDIIIVNYTLVNTGLGLAAFNVPVSGAIDGVNVDFTCAGYTAGSLQVIYNGSILENGTDFTEVANGFTFVTVVPNVGDVIWLNLLQIGVTLLDEKVRSDAGDPYPGYLTDKVDHTTIDVDTVNHVQYVVQLGLSDVLRYANIR